MSITRALAIVVVFSSLLIQAKAFSADWPMWRHGLERNGVSSEALPEMLNPHWSSKLAAPKPAGAIGGND